VGQDITWVKQFVLAVGAGIGFWRGGWWRGEQLPRSCRFWEWVGRLS
jgi:hypothetical protein